MSDAVEPVAAETSETPPCGGGLKLRNRFPPTSRKGCASDSKKNQGMMEAWEFFCSWQLQILDGQGHLDVRPWGSEGLTGRLPPETSLARCAA